jgi:hypothetical protein
MEQDIVIGAPEFMEMPPEPPQKRAEEVGLVRKPHRQERNKGFELPQPQRVEREEEKEEKVEEVTPAEAKAAAVRPNLDRLPVRQKGKIQRKAPRGQARPL